MRRRRNKIVPLVLSLIMALTFVMPVSARDYQLTEEADLECCTNFHEFEVYDFFHELHDHSEYPETLDSSCFHLWIERNRSFHEIAIETCGNCRGRVEVWVSVYLRQYECGRNNDCKATWPIESFRRVLSVLGCLDCPNPLSVPQDDPLW